MKVKAKGAFAYRGKFLSGQCEVADKDVARLVRLGLVETPPEAPTPARPDEPEDLERFTVVQLKDMAKEKRVKGYFTMSKAQLIAALRGNVSEEKDQEDEKEEG